MVTDARGERDVGIVQVCGTPGEGPGIECDEEDGVAVGFGAAEQGNGYFVVLRPVELEEADTVTAGFGDLFDAAAPGCAENIGDPEVGCNLGNANLFVLVKDGLDADRGNQER